MNSWFPLIWTRSNIHTITGNLIWYPIWLGVTEEHCCSVGRSWVRLLSYSIEEVSSRASGIWCPRYEWLQVIDESLKRCHFQSRTWSLGLLQSVNRGSITYKQAGCWTSASVEITAIYKRMLSDDSPWPHYIPNIPHTDRHWCTLLPTPYLASVWFRYLALHLHLSICHVHNDVRVGWLSNSCSWSSVTWGSGDLWIGNRRALSLSLYYRECDKLSL